MSTLPASRKGQPIAWPEGGLPKDRPPAGWIARALSDPAGVEPHRRNAIYKERVLMRKAAAFAQGRADVAAGLAAMGTDQVARTLALAERDRAAAAEAAVRFGRGEIGHGDLKAIAAADVPLEAARASSVPEWPLAVPALTGDGGTGRWDAIAEARRCSGLKGAAFAAQHNLAHTRVRRATMVMTAARTIADGDARRARRILALPEYKIFETAALKGSDPARYAQALAALDRAAGRSGR